MESLVAALRQERRRSRLTADDVAAMVAPSSKQRHEIDGGRIRAMYGHSTPARIARTPPNLRRCSTTGRRRPRP